MIVCRFLCFFFFFFCFLNLALQNLSHLWINFIWAASSEKCLRGCAKYADSHHPAHAQGLIRAFVLHCYILKYPMILAADRRPWSDCSICQNCLAGTQYEKVTKVILVQNDGSSINCIEYPLSSYLDIILANSSCVCVCFFFFFFFLFFIYLFIYFFKRVLDGKKKKQHILTSNVV